MSATIAAKITYRKTQKGEWVAFGPAAVIKAGATVTVTKRDGSTKTELIESAGRPFTASGEQMCYGYLAKSAPAPRRASGRDRWARADGSCRCYCHSVSYGGGIDGSFDGCDRCGCDGDC